MPSFRRLGLALLLATAVASSVHAAEANSVPLFDPAPGFDAVPPSSRFT